MSTSYNRTIEAIVIHHMGDGLPPSVPISQRWNPYNYDYPEYDFGIEADGEIVTGRPLDVIGSHTKSDREPYSINRGTWWFNKNAIGIGLAGDFTKYPMPHTQFNALVSLVKRLMSQYGLTLDNVYPHGQVTHTDCPGCTYSKIPELNGLWSYDEFEKAVLGEVISMSEPNKIIAPTDIYLSVRVLEHLADQAIIDINKLGFAAKKLELA